MNRIGDIDGKNILLLQGPMGSFFKRLDDHFRAEGASTFKIGLNAGDQFFSNRDNFIPYRGDVKDWKEFVSQFVIEHEIDKLFVFGDCRIYQRIAIGAAEEADIEVFVFEEGYFRPDYITLERFGVNDYSHISREKKFYEALELETLPDPSTLPTYSSPTWMVMSAIIYYLLSNLFLFRYPHYQHHRDFSSIKEAFFGIRNLIRKYYYRVKERHHLSLITGAFSKTYFFVPLQTYNDFQILQHSDYLSIEKFIIEVLESFAKKAPDDTHLVFKHHPVDRGRKDYADFIYHQAELLHIEKRVLLFHDVHLPTCIKNARGTVTISSTVGLSSLYHQIPTITLGNAIYDIEGLTCKDCSLDDFWLDSKPPDKALFERFRRYLIQTTQLNGSFYGSCPAFENM